MSEYEDTIKLAEHVLNRHNADPDDDLAMLSRQFLRLREYKAMGEEVAAARAVLSALNSFLAESPDSEVMMTFAESRCWEEVLEMKEAYDRVVSTSGTLGAGVRGKGQADV